MPPVSYDGYTCTFLPDYRNIDAMSIIDRLSYWKDKFDNYDENDSQLRQNEIVGMINLYLKELQSPLFVILKEDEEE